MSKRLRGIIEEIGAPLPAWLESTPTEARAEHKVSLWELRNLSKNLLVDMEILSIIHKDRSNGWWLSSLAQEAGLSKGVVSRSIKRLKESGLCWTRKKRVDGSNALFVHPGPKKGEPTQRQKKGVKTDCVLKDNPYYVSTFYSASTPPERSVYGEEPPIFDSWTTHNRIDWWHGYENEGGK